VNSGNAIVLVDAGYLIKALLIHAGMNHREQVAIDYEALSLHLPAAWPWEEAWQRLLTTANSPPVSA